MIYWFMGLFFSELNGKHLESITINCFNVHICFDECLPFVNQRAQFVPSEVHTVEVSKASGTVDVINSEFYLSERLLCPFVSLQEKFQLHGFSKIRGNLYTKRY